MNPAESNPHAEAGPKSRPANWMDRVASVLFAVLCLEVGLFLLIYPWTESWNWNLLVTANPQWTEALRSDQFRGAISGLGVLNLIIGLWEAVRLRRFSRTA